MKLPVADCVFFLLLLLLPLPFPIVKEIQEASSQSIRWIRKKMVTFVLHYIVNATPLTWTTF